MVLAFVELVPLPVHYRRITVEPKSMKFSLYYAVSTLLLAGSLPAAAQADDTAAAWRAGLPLEQTASRGITTRDPSTIVKCKDEFWVYSIPDAAFLIPFQRPGKVGARPFRVWDSS